MHQKNDRDSARPSPSCLALPTYPHSVVPVPEQLVHRHPPSLCRSWPDFEGDCESDPRFLDFPLLRVPRRLFLPDPISDFEIEKRDRESVPSPNFHNLFIDSFQITKLIIYVWQFRFHDIKALVRRCVDA